MFRIDADTDIAEDEAMPEFSTGHTVKKESDRATAIPNDTSDPPSNAGDSAALTGDSVAQYHGTKDGQGHLDSQLSLEDYENIIGSIKPSQSQLTSIFTQSDSPDGMANEVKVETD